MRWPNPILWAGWSDRLVGELMIRGQFDIGAGGGWEWQLFSLLFPPIIIFKCPHIRHSPASLYPSWENLHHLFWDWHCWNLGFEIERSLDGQGGFSLIRETAAWLTSPSSKQQPGEQTQLHKLCRQICNYLAFGRVPSTLLVILNNLIAMI